MSFPTKVKENALVACGRHCCICHKFCGTKIELHHIHPKANGGEDTFENCIPLCFDCHADMVSYDFKHPKGTKYSENELKRHRDNWYKKVKDSIGLPTLPEHIDLDKEVFLRLKSLLPWNGSILFIRQNNFNENFKFEKLNDFEEFLRACEDPTFEFIDADLEGQRADLSDSIYNFFDAVRKEIFPAAAPGYSRIPREWQWKQPERYKNACNSLEETSNAINEQYNLLIKLGRRKLGI